MIVKALVLEVSSVSASDILASLIVSATNNYKPTYQWQDDDDKSDTKSVDGRYHTIV